MRNLIEYLNHLYAIRDAYPVDSPEYACYQRAVTLANEYATWGKKVDSHNLERISDKDKKALYLCVSQAESKLENATGLKLPSKTMALLNRVWLAVGDLKKDLCQHT